MSYLFFNSQFPIDLKNKVIVTTNNYFLRRQEIVNFVTLNGWASGPLV